MHGIKLLLPLLCLFSGPAQGPPSADALAGKSQRGKELMAAGRYTEAVPVYRELVAAMPGNPGLLANLGMALHLAGEDEAAVAPLQAALRLEPGSLPANLFLGAANLRLGRAAAAIAPLRKVVRLQPANREARSMLAEALVASEDYAGAEPHLRRLARSMPSDPAAWFNLGNAYEELAGRTFAELRDRDPESPFALALAADERARRGQSAAAFRLYRKALERGAAIHGLHAAVADIYRSAGHPDWAAVEEGRERQRPRPDCARQRLECDFAQRKYHEVAAAAARSKEPAARYWLARAYGALASQAFDRLAALPASALFHERMAEVRRSARRYPDAIDHWRKAIALAPEDPGLRMELAVTLRQNHDLAGAQQVFEELLAVAPDAPDLNYFLGDVLLGRDEPARAVPFLEKSVKLEPGAPHAHGALGRAYALTGRAADALIHLRQALPADVDGSLRYQLARAYQATGQPEQARAALRDYEEFRKALADAEPADEAAIVPPL